MNIQCIQCKGRHFCGREFCPIQAKVSAKNKHNFKKEYFGQAPNVFVGHYGYPDINFGILNTEHYTEHDEPLQWAKKNYGVGTVIDLRTSLVNSMFRANIRDSNKFLELGKEIAMANKPVEVELMLNKVPSFSVSLNRDVAPHGPNVKLEKARITENPKIPQAAEKIVRDEIKAAPAITLLYKKGYDEHYITKLLTSGNLGIDRKLVPTRWGITAVDDTLGKKFIDKAKDYNYSEYYAYFDGYNGNYYLILTFPGPWAYELFEMHVRSTEFMTDFEDANGRKEYAEETAGGYYAARLAILEGLEKIKRQARVLTLRFITDEYWAPLGVWVVREASRKAMTARPIEFGSKELMLKYAQSFARKKWGYNISNILSKSRLLAQRRVTDYLS